MLSPFDIPCNANNLRGELFHDWLKNQVLNKTPDSVVRRYEKHAMWRKLETEFEDRISQANKLSNEMVDGFSPKQLIDQIMIFSTLSEYKKELLKKTIHEAYLKNSNIETISESLKVTIPTLKHDICELKKAWQNKDKESVRDRYQDLLNSANLLHNILAMLPKGVTLP